MPPTLRAGARVRHVNGGASGQVLDPCVAGNRNIVKVAWAGGVVCNALRNDLAFDTPADPMVRCPTCGGGTPRPRSSAAGAGTRCPPRPRCPVAEHPILFSAPMVRALLAGQKTQTRRVIGLPELHRSTTQGYDWTWRGQAPVRSVAQQRRHPGGCCQDVRHADLARLCPYGGPGDRLWVRETFARDVPGCDRGVSYRADHIDPRGDGPARPMRWRPSIFMPRELSRLTLDVGSIRVERVQQITEEDAAAEGVAHYDPEHLGHGVTWELGPGFGPREVYAHLWDRINGARKGCAWADDPWVWVVTFRRAEVSNG